MDVLELDVAPCREAPELFFPENHAPREVYERARAICAGCPNQTPCLEYAVSHDEQGIWAGTTRLQRQRIRKARGLA